LRDFDGGRPRQRQDRESDDDLEGPTADEYEDDEEDRQPHDRTYGRREEEDDRAEDQGSYARDRDEQDDDEDGRAYSRGRDEQGNRDEGEGHREAPQPGGRLGSKLGGLVSAARERGRVD
jgi:hypothetical protein